MAFLHFALHFFDRLFALLVPLLLVLKELGNFAFLVVTVSGGAGTAN